MMPEKSKFGYWDSCAVQPEVANRMHDHAGY